MIPGLPAQRCNCWMVQPAPIGSFMGLFFLRKKQPHEAADRDEQPSKQILRGEFLNFIVGERAGVLQREMSVKLKFIANPSGSFPLTCTNHTNHHKSKKQTSNVFHLGLTFPALASAGIQTLYSARITCGTPAASARRTWSIKECLLV